MEAYFGTDQQMALQKKADDYSDWMYATPGACNPGRFIGTDDPDRLGWETIFEHLLTDELFGFRMIPNGNIPAIESKLGQEGFHIKFWDVFSAPAALASSKIEKMDLQIPQGYGLVDRARFRDIETVQRVQNCMVENGIAPVSGALLNGTISPCAAIAIEAENGEIAATAFGYFPHNEHSPHFKSAWGGLVSVMPNHRNLRLGVLVNALMVRACIEDLNAEYVHELVATTNVISRKMVENCGLSHDPNLKCGSATRAGVRFTK